MKRGFTLIELMVTVAIIAIITVVSITTYSTFSTKGKWSDVQPCIADVANRLENYRSNNGIYPTGSDPYADLGLVPECNDHYVGTITVFNNGANYLVVYLDSGQQIGSSSWDHDAWAVIDVGTKIYHVSNPADPQDVDTLPGAYNSLLPSFTPSN